MTGGNGARGNDPYGIRDFYRGQSVPTQGAVLEGRAGMDRAVRQLSEIREHVQDNPESAQNVQDIIRMMQRLNQPGNPRVLEQMRAELLPQIEQLETKLRRQLEGDQPQNVRAAGAERVPPAYRDAVAEYYRRLSKVK